MTKQSLKTTTTVSSVRSSSDVATLVMDIGQAILTARMSYDDSDATHSRDKGVEVKGVSPHQPSLREEPEVSLNWKCYNAVTVMFDFVVGRL